MQTFRTSRSLRAQRGFTLVEVMIGVAVLLLATGGVTLSMRAFAKSELRSSAFRVAGAMRYLFGRARSSGKTYRLVFDLDEGKIWAERAEGLVLFKGKRDGESALAGGAEATPLPFDDALKELGSSAEDESAAQATVSSSMNKTGKAQTREQTEGRASPFSAFSEAALKPITLPKRVRIADVQSSRMTHRKAEGTVYLYFFPQGYTQAARVRLSSGEQFFRLLMHPLTGRVEVGGGGEGEGSDDRGFDDLSAFSSLEQGG